MPVTALQHFREDISRTQALIDHADSLATTSDAEQMLRSDVLRSAWMFAVGALDAYFCDAYTDLVAATLSSKSRQPAMTLPEVFYNIKVPVWAILEQYTKENWRWRMAARRMMEKENVLKLQVIKDLFNKFFRRGFKLFNDLLDDWIRRPEATIRLFGVPKAAYLAMNSAQQEQARKDAMEKLEERFFEIFQRRHDCIHNCDRPKIRPQLLTRSGTVQKVIKDIEFLVVRCDAHINAEFREFLLASGCSAATVTAAGY